MFDAAIYAFFALAVVIGFTSGLLRSMATIIGYVAAAPVAFAVSPALSAFLVQHFDMRPSYNGVVLAALLLITGMLFALLLRRAIGDVTGPDIGIVDRVTGALLGAGRIAFVAVLVVVIFDRIIPQGRQPVFLADSQLYPYLSHAGRAGVQALPPDVIAFIDRMKRERGI